MSEIQSIEIVVKLKESWGTLINEYFNSSNFDHWISGSHW